MMSRRSFYGFLGFLVVAVCSYWMARSAGPGRESLYPTERRERPRWSVFVNPEPERPYRMSERKKDTGEDGEALEAGALEGQRWLVFRDRKSLEDFLRRAGDRVLVLGRNDALNALHVAFSDLSDLDGLLEGDEELALIFPVTFPEQDDIAVQPGAVPFGRSLLEWLGITGNNSEWGSGVTIAVLDTGVNQHPAFSSSVRSLIFGNSAVAGDVHGHGTAVASMILGNNSQVQGVAPGASVLSVRIANEQGYSDSFTLAQGITAAVDAGVPIINISMGSHGDSLLVRNALAYAREHGVLVIAPTGNDGFDGISYPGANEGVIAVGGVDRNGSHLLFSNTGDSVALAAPGYGLNAGWVNDEAVSVSGTSFSTPITAGLIAAVMTHGGVEPMPAPQALETIYHYANDAAAPGPDRWTGRGVPDMGRILNAGTPGIHDAALASHWVTTEGGYSRLQVVVENRGTETLVNTGVQVSSPAGENHFNITTLAPGRTQVFAIPLPAGEGEMRFDSRVHLSGGQRDAKQSNDRRVENYTPAQSR